MRATTRGKLVIEICIAFLFSAILFSDFSLLVIFAVLLLIVISEVATTIFVTRRIGRFVSASRSSDHREKFEIARKIYPGDASVAEFFMLKSNLIAVRLDKSVEFASFSPNSLGRRARVSLIRIEFKTPYSGEYSTNRLNIVVSSPLGLFDRRSSIPASLTFTVNPRVIDVAITSFKLFGGGSGIGEFPTNVPGVGTEFYELRRYETGDEFKRINWKATARLDEIMVGERSKEIGGSFYLVLEAIATNYFDKDRLATAFLELANSMALYRWRFGVVVHDGENVAEIKTLDIAPNSLAFAREVALDFAEVNQAIFGEQFAAIPSHLIRSNKNLLLEMGFESLSQIEDYAQLSQRSMKKTQSIQKTLNDILKDSVEERPTVLYVSGMFGSVTPIIEMAGQFRKVYGLETIVVNPAASWVVAPNVEEGAELYEKHLRNLKALRIANVKYYAGDPLKIAIDVFSR